MKTNPPPPERPSPAFKAFVESQIQEILQPDRLSSDRIQSPPRPARRSRSVTPPPPPTLQTRLDGYRAAAIAVQNMMEEAYAKRPRKMGGREQLAAYREGYYAGLLLAHCQFAFGEFPQHNATAIKVILSQHAQPDSPADHDATLRRRCEQTWNTCYPDRRPWSEIGVDAQAEWLRVFGIFDQTNDQTETQP